MPLNLDNADTIAAALEAAEAKAGGTLAERVEARREMREIAAALRQDRHGFLRSFDEIEAAYREGVKDGASGKVPPSGTGLAQGVADYERRRRVALGLPPV